MTEDEEVVEMVAPPEAAGDRLDRFLAVSLDRPRNQIQRWIECDRVWVDGRSAKPSRTLTGGEIVRYQPLGPVEDDRVEPEPGELMVLHEDDDIVVLDKPSGLAMHPGAGRPRGTLAHRLLAAYPEIAGVGGPGRPGIVHRLDIDTTGVVVIARSASAYRVLSEAFADRQVEKTYLALAYGVPSPPAGTWTGAIGRHPRRRREMTVRPDGRAAQTDYDTMATAAGVSLLRIGLGTGRTHQIRVHLKAAGHPLVGDATYGEARWKALAPAVRRPLQSFGRPALHAWRLVFDHPSQDERVSFVAPPPDDLEALWDRLADGSPMPLGSATD